MNHRTSGDLEQWVMSRLEAGQGGLGVCAEAFAERRGGADYKIIFRLKGAVAQRAAVIGRNVERKYRQPAPRIQEQLQDETHLAAWTSPAAVCEHASSPFADVLPLAYRSRKTDRLLSLSELIWRRSRNPSNGAGLSYWMPRAAGSLADFLEPLRFGRPLPCLFI